MGSGSALIEAMRNECVPRDAENRLLPILAAGQAPDSVFQVLATEQATSAASAIRSLLMLSARSGPEPVRTFFLRAASIADQRRTAFAPLATVDTIEASGKLEHDPMPGCQIYSSFVAWLAVNAEPSTAAVALIADASHVGGHRRIVAAAMREHYDNGSTAGSWTDGTTNLVQPSIAVAAVDAGLASGELDEFAARRYARLLQAYELMFWNTLADLAEAA